MSYRSMTVCLDHNVVSNRLQEFAITVAARNEAHLTAIYLTYIPPAVYDLYSQAGPMIVEWERQEEERRAAAEKAFRHSAQLAGVNSDWVVCRDLDWRQAILHARTSDLAIVGQRNPETSDLNAGFYDSFVLKAGRPVLFLPYACTIPKSFDNVIVAWDGSREAARALADSMPLLKKARSVTVLSVVKGKDRPTDLPDVSVGAYLARHGINAQVEKNTNVSVDPAQWLLSRAADVSADLLVMGGYGHSRISEIALGGVTRTMMRQMTLPVLMSH